MSPSAFLYLTILITVAMALGWRIVRRRRARLFRRTAAQWQMRYCPGDQFRLADRLAACFPIVGAADVRILDLMYGGDDAAYRYIFTVEYTLGLIRAKHRHSRVLQLIEPRVPGQTDIHIELAPSDRPLFEQYQFFAPADNPQHDLQQLLAPKS
jgi:hypothetical protein